MKKHVLSLSLTLAFAPLTSFAVSDSPDELMALDLNQLMQVKLAGTATLTPTATRRLPASITSITRTMIVNSGARSLFDLFDIYVPNFQYLPHHWEAPHMGMRGLIGDRDDKYLLVVNGRVLNEKTHFGALSERDLPMLGDIRKIDVVRGPGSVVYGPGAVSMVINIQTDTFADHGEDGATVKVGAVENFKSLELKKSFSFDPNGRHGLLLYAGITDYDGSSNANSNLVYGLSDTTSWGQPVTGGQAASFKVPNNHEAFADQAKIKLHGHYQNDDFNAWLRYTRGGEKLTWEHKVFLEAPNGFALAGRPFEDYSVGGVGYEQWTLDLSQTWALSPKMWFELKGGYDSTVYERILWDSFLPGKTPENHREEEYLVRGTLNWNPNSEHALAMGGEYIYSRWGLNSGRYDQPVSFTLGNMDAWHTQSLGVFAEHQWQLTNNLTQFIGLRADRDQYTDIMWSPRWALVSAISDHDTVKTILSRSLRKNNAEELRGQNLKGQKGDPEQLTSAELIYNRALGGGSTASISSFYNKAEIMGIDFTTLNTKPVADFKYGGLELELNYKGADWSLMFSHAYTKLFHFEVAPGASTRVAGSHLVAGSRVGYGNDLNNWSNHSTKLSGEWRVAPDWTLTGDMRVFWKYQGAQDQIDHVHDLRLLSPTSSSGNLTDPGYNTSTGTSAFLDLGAQYQIAKNQNVSLNGYNLLGLFDKTLNKRLYLLNVGNYRADATALAINYTYMF